MTDVTRKLVKLRRADLVAVLRDLETIVVSLDRIGAASGSDPETEYNARLARFIADWRVFDLLATARRILSEPFSDEVGLDGMDELEREMLDVPAWSIAAQRPPRSTKSR